MTSASRPPRHRVTLIIAGILLGVCGCTVGQPIIGAWPRPSPLVGEWVDIEKSSPADTTLWVLGADGYDGAAHLRLVTDSSGALHPHREEHRYGSWYFDGLFGDATHQQICFSKRIGRFGATCTSFTMDTVVAGGVGAPRLLLKDYRGQHHTRDRLLVSRTTKVAQ